MKAIVACLLFMVIEGAYAASFDCGGKLNAAENMICSNEVLSRLDEELSMLYKYIKFNNAEKQEQLNSIEERNKCQEIACIAAWYDDQIDAFEHCRLPVKECISSKGELTALANKDEDNYFYLDGELELNGDGSNELIYVSGGCNAHCMYAVYELKDGCYHEIASFSAREYFVVPPTSNELAEYINKEDLDNYRKHGVISEESFMCLLINNVESVLDVASSPKYEPWCFDRK